MKFERTLYGLIIAILCLLLLKYTPENWIEDTKFFLLIYILAVNRFSINEIYKKLK